jgi:hypothetical protein
MIDEKKFQGTKVKNFITRKKEGGKRVLRHNKNTKRRGFVIHKKKGTHEITHKKYRKKNSNKKTKRGGGRVKPKKYIKKIDYMGATRRYASNLRHFANFFCRTPEKIKKKYLFMLFFTDFLEVYYDNVVATGLFNKNTSNINLDINVKKSSLGFSNDTYTGSFFRKTENIIRHISYGSIKYTKVLSSIIYRNPFLGVFLVATMQIANGVFFLATLHPNPLLIGLSVATSVASKVFIVGSAPFMKRPKKEILRELDLTYMIKENSEVFKMGMDESNEDFFESMLLFFSGRIPGMEFVETKSSYSYYPPADSNTTDSNTTDSNTPDTKITADVLEESKGKVVNSYKEIEPFLQEGDTNLAQLIKNMNKDYEEISTFMENEYKKEVEKSESSIKDIVVKPYIPPPKPPTIEEVRKTIQDVQKLMNEKTPGIKAHVPIRKAIEILQIILVALNRQVSSKQAGPDNYVSILTKPIKNYKNALDEYLKLHDKPKLERSETGIDLKKLNELNETDVEIPSTTK